MILNGISGSLRMGSLSLHLHVYLAADKDPPVPSAGQEP